MKGVDQLKRGLKIGNVDLDGCRVEMCTERTFNRGRNFRKPFNGEDILNGGTAAVPQSGN